MGPMTEWQAALWFLIGLPTTMALLGWATFAMIHADEAKGRKREDELRKRQSTDG